MEQLNPYRIIKSGGIVKQTVMDISRYNKWSRGRVFIRERERERERGDRERGNIWSEYSPGVI